MELKYGKLYDERLGEDTLSAEEWYIDARNGYIDNVNTLIAVRDLLISEYKKLPDGPDRDKREDWAERVGYMVERETLDSNEKIDTSVYNIGGLKLDFMDGIGGVDEELIGDGMYLSIILDRDNVAVSVTDTEEDTTHVSALTLEEFKGMSQEEMEVFIGQVIAYS